MYFRSDYYGGDERVEVTGTKGFARFNRMSAHGIQEPPLVVYRDGEMRGYHALGDDPVKHFGPPVITCFDTSEPEMGRFG
jgi:hypothetical protein